MAELGERERAAVARLFAGAARPVRVRVVLPGGPGPGPRTGLRAALAEVAEMVPLVRVEECDAAAAGPDVERTPAVVLLDEEGTDLRVRFYGLPTGYEFTSLLAAVADAAAPTTALQPETVQALEGLHQDVQITGFSTPSCPYCPRAVRLGSQMALLSPHIRAEAIDAAHFTALAGLYQVRGVPRTVFNRRLAVEGAVPEATFLQNVLAAAGA